MKEPPVRIAVEPWRDNQKGRIGQEKVLSHNYGNRTAFVQSARLMNVDSEHRRLQTKFPNIFGLYSSAVSGEKERVVCYLMQLYMYIYFLVMVQQAA